jgi:hypothetical protein
MLTVAVVRFKNVDLGRKMYVGMHVHRCGVIKSGHKATIQSPATLKKNGSIDERTGVTPSRPKSVCDAKS